MLRLPTVDSLSSQSANKRLIGSWGRVPAQVVSELKRIITTSQLNKLRITSIVTLMHSKWFTIMLVKTAKALCISRLLVRKLASANERRRKRRRRRKKGRYWWRRKPSLSRRCRKVGRALVTRLQRNLISCQWSIKTQRCSHALTTSKTKGVSSSWSLKRYLTTHWPKTRTWMEVRRQKRALASVQAMRVMEPITSKC